MILVSACLLGINCKYNGDNNKNEKVAEYLKDKQFIMVCPEQLGGLSTPRDPSEIIRLDGNAVIEGKNSGHGIFIIKSIASGLHVDLNASIEQSETKKNIICLTLKYKVHEYQDNSNI